MNLKKVEIINYIEKLLDENVHGDVVEEIIIEYLKQHPKDVDKRIQFAIFFSDIPIADPRVSIRLLEDALKIDQGNPIALVILAYIYDRLWSGISEDLYNQLEHAKTYNDETKGMIELAKAWYYATGWYRERANEELYEKYLLSSVQYGNKFVWNYRDLAVFYWKKNLFEKCKYYAKKALENIQELDTDRMPDLKEINIITTSESFLNELIKGTHINDSQIKTIPIFL